MLFEMHHSMFFCHSQIKLLDTHHHTWSVSSTWLQGGGSGDTQSMSGGTNEPQHRLLFPNNSPQLSSLISHHPNTHMSNPPLHPLTHSHPTPQSSPTESADAHSTQHTQPYLIFVIFFTQAKFLENKIYTVFRQCFANFYQFTPKFAPKNADFCQFFALNL